MAYTPENNPYIPGDPYSYDLKWIVKQLKTFEEPEKFAKEAKASAEAASISEVNAKTSEDNAKTSETKAAASAASAKNYADHIADPVAGLVTDWLTDNITQPTTPIVDASLSVGGAAADAEVTGDKIAELKALAPEDLAAYFAHNDTSSNGIDWTWSNDYSVIHVDGIALNASTLALIAKTALSNTPFEANREYYLDFAHDVVHLAVRCFDAGDNQILYADFNEPVYFAVPADATKIALTLVVSKDESLSNEVIDAPKVYGKQLLDDLTTIVGQLTNKISINETIPTDDDCVNVFLSELNALAASWNMTDTVINSPHGMENDSEITPADMLQAAVAFSSFPDLMDICATPDFTLSIYGQRARTISVTNSYLSTIATKLAANGDYALGGKGGSLDYGANDKSRTQLTYADIAGHYSAICLMGYGATSYANIYDTASDVAEALKAVYNGSTPTVTTNMTELITSGGGYAAMEIPRSGIMYAKGLTSSDNLTRFESTSDGESNVNRPCSVIKMMSAYLALQYIVDKSAYISIHLDDIEAGSGSPYYVGDRLNVIDAIKAMLVESSNTLAHAIARYVGTIILSGRA